MCRVRIEVKAIGVMTSPEPPHGITESHRGPACDLIALLVHRLVMPAAEQREVRQRRRPALRPVVEMMGLNYPHSAPGKAAGPVSMQERAA